MTNSARVYRVALVGVLGAQALALSWLESLLPAFPFLPPGFKPGLSNIVVMFAVSQLNLPAALFLVLIKAGFALVTRGATAALTSLFGGLFSMGMMALLLRPRRKVFGLVGVGVCSALMHNLGQLLAAMLLTGTGSLVSYAPALLVFGALTGTVTGCVFKAVMPLLEKQSKYFISRKAK